MRTPSGYTYTRADLPVLLSRSFFPEYVARESVLARAFLAAHGEEFDRYTFSVRVGTVHQLDPGSPEWMQRYLDWSMRRRIDLVVEGAGGVTLIEVKVRVTPEVLGQLLAYRVYYLEARPELTDVALSVIGRYSDPDTLRVLQGAGVTTYLYDVGPGEARSETPAPGPVAPAP